MSRSLTVIEESDVNVHPVPCGQVPVTLRLGVLRPRPRLVWWAY